MTNVQHEQVAGWYPDPERPEQLRWWDGVVWTDQIHAAASEPPAQPAALKWVVPVGRSRLAIAAGYAGLFGLIVIPAPIALILGVLAIRDVRHHEDKAGMGRALFGTIVGVLGTAVIVYYAAFAP